MYLKGWRFAPVSLVAAAILVTSAGCSGGSPASPTAAPGAAAAAKPAATQPASAQSAPTAVEAPTSAPPAATAAAPTAPAKAAAAPPIASALGNEYTFTLVTTMAGQPPQTSKLAVKNGKVRMETTAAGQQMVTIADNVNKVAYVVMAGQNRVLKMPYDQFQSQQKGSLTGPDALSAYLAGAPVVGSETIDGHPCDIYSITTSGVASKMWVAKDTSLPMKAETTVGGQTATVMYQDFKAASLDDSLFQPPAGMPVTDMSSFAGQQPNVPAAPTTKP